MPNNRPDKTPEKMYKSTVKVKKRKKCRRQLY